MRFFLMKKNNFNALMKILEPTINQALFLSGTVIKNRAKKNFKPAKRVGVTSSGKIKYAVPQSLGSIHERTGELRLSIQESPVQNFSITVGTSKKYALVNELGGAFIPARPFLKPAAFESKEEIKNI